MIIVSSLEHAVEAFRRYKPGYVVSILEFGEPTPPIFDTLAPENHIKLIENCSQAAKSGDCGLTRCATLANLAARWDGQSPILIHCNQGVARSTAAAYIIMCEIQPNHCEREIATRLRKAAPHAEPNLLLVSEADALLGRNDRMIEAILDLCPCSPMAAAPIVILPLEG